MCVIWRIIKESNLYHTNVFVFLVLVGPIYLQNTGVSASDALDVVITNALIVDSVTGIIKADVGIKGNRIVGIGKAGNPDMMRDVDPNMIVGVTTDVIAGEKMILTAGGIDTHVHWIWYVYFFGNISPPDKVIFCGCSNIVFLNCFLFRFSFVRTVHNRLKML